jgi:hypothetical protein
MDRALPYYGMLVAVTGLAYHFAYRGAFMARVSGAPVGEGGALYRFFKRMVYSRVRRRLGRVVMPVQVTAHHPEVFRGYIGMERAQMAARLVDGKLKGLAVLRVATLVGCPF